MPRARPETSRATDAAQDAVIELPAEASGVVIGGPGTGKTETLVARVAALVRSGVGTDELVVLTPTRQTATALRDRLALATPAATSGPLARSVASLAFQLVRAAAVHDGAEPPRLLSAADQDRILAELLAGDAEDADDAATGRHRWPESVPAMVRSSRTFRAELRALLAEATELGVEPDELADLGQATKRAAWTAAASFIREYRDALGAMRASSRDPADLLAEASMLLRTAPAGVAAQGRLGPAARLRVVLVDDAQELTRGGATLLRALRSRGVAVLAFGDPDIASGAFRGASPALFAQLCDLLGQVHVLRAPYRSNAAVTSLTRSITAAIGVAGRVEHRMPPGAIVADAAAIQTIVAPSPFEEVDRIARALREWHVMDEVAWHDMAVIAHDTRQVADLEVELAAREVPTRAAGVQRPLGKEQVVRDLLLLVRVAMTDPSERSADDLTAALSSPFGALDAVALRRLRARLRQAELADGGTRAASELLRDALAHPLVLAGIDTAEGRSAETLATTLATLHAEAERGATIHELVWIAWDRARDASGRRVADVWRELAASGGVFAIETNAALDALVALFDAAKRDVERAGGAGPASFVHRMLDSDVPEDTLSAPERLDAVSVLTPAAALGTQFEAVVIAGMQDGIWPNVRVRGGILDPWRLADAVTARRAGSAVAEVPAVLDRRRAALHDELRLLVRSVSRARSRLVVTAVNDDDLGPSALLSLFPDPAGDAAERGENGATEHPLTLRGLVAQHRRTLTTAGPAATQSHAAAQLVLLSAARVAGAAPGEWYGMRDPSSTGPLRDPARGPVHVSPSRIEGFAECPLDWAIRALGGDTRSWSAGVGTILHAAMEEVPSGESALLQQIVDDRWGELEFEAPWLSRKEHAWATLLVGRMHAYLHRFHAENGRTIGAEATFRLAIDMDAPPDAPPDSAPVVRAARPDEPIEGRVAVLSGTVDRVEVYPGGWGEAVPADPDRPDAARVMIVDLKTGRSEKRVSDDKVADDPQLAAYQLAFVTGQLPGADVRDNAGARLLVLSKTLRNADYRLARQPPMDDGARAAFVRRIVETARGMAADRFDAHLDTHCAKDVFAVCPVHTVKAVSAS